MKISKQAGFTLVEIAIVLVIIGLLLGGILKGQELINSARVRNLADQNSGVQAAYYGFIDRYRQIPGDFPAANATQAIGVQVNLPITGTAGNGRLDNTLEEAAAVWEQLARAQFLAGGFTPATAAPTSEALYVTNQISPINPFNGVLILSRNRGYSGLRAERLNLHMGRNVPVSIARELDVKVDDGLPNTGILRLTVADGTATVFDAIEFASNVANCTATNTSAPGAVVAGGGANTDIYNIFGDEQDCPPVFVY